MRIHRYLLFW
ncbi:hypothetical protein LINPERPRIM_LOCUS38887 [Linum perenne]